MTFYCMKMRGASMRLRNKQMHLACHIRQACHRFVTLDMSPLMASYGTYSNQWKCI